MGFPKVLVNWTIMTLKALGLTFGGSHSSRTELSMVILYYTVVNLLGLELTLMGREKDYSDYMTTRESFSKR